MMALYQITATVAALTVVLSCGVGLLAWRQRPEPGTTSLAVAMFAAAWWMATLGIGSGADALAEKLFWVRLEWVGVAVLPVAWFLFALEYTGRSDGLTRPGLAGVSAVVAAAVGVVWTNPRELVRTDVALEVSGGVAHLDQTYGPLFWLLTGAMLTLASLGTAALLALAVRSRSLYRGQAVALSVAAVLPQIGVLTFLANLPAGTALNAIPITFTLSGVLNVWAVSRYRLLQRLPVPRRVARDVVVEQMDDGVLVIDGRGEVVDANDRAADLLGDRTDPVGRPAEQRVPGYAAAVEDGETVVVTDGANCRWLKVRVTPVRNVHDRITGRIVVLRDVTDQRNREQRLDVLNRVLRHNLRNEINVVYGYADHLGDDPDDDVADVIKEKASAIVELADKAREVERILEAANSDGEPVDALAALEYALADVETEADVGTVDLIPPEGEDDVRIDVAAEGAGIPKAELRAVRDESETQLNHANGLRLWLVVWGTRQIGGSVTFHPEDRDSVVTIRVARRDSPRETAAATGSGGWPAEG